MAAAMKRQIPALIACLMGIAPAAYATDFDLGQGFQTTIGGSATLGTMLRTDTPNPDNYGLVPSSTVPGATPGRLLGPTGGSDLNYRRDHPVSTVVKVLADLDVHTSDKKFGAFVRTIGWYDFTLGHADAAYGNYSNRCQANAPLSDNGFAKEAKFNNMLFRDAYVYGQFDLPQGMVLDARTFHSPTTTSPRTISRGSTRTMSSLRRARRSSSSCPAGVTHAKKWPEPCA